jgi:hypothetical protein
VLASYEFAPEFSLSSQWLLSPADGSGVVVPSATWTMSDRWSAVFSAYVPYGPGAAGATLTSEYGSSPAALFVQIRMYR